ncbi:hypothetical protein HG537_0D03490 [Torulaspora globosa]|uniref:Glycosyltransferase family 71 protein n=1 Tax=Torulaspora globosa TaxID=48254 RepID=A0A7H9HRH1_9SACH|nr:hypothetical protein HG537_0D03490 [Torulaspora sp. CBS 2947]
MVLVPRRYAKALKLTVGLILFCVLVVLSNNFMDENHSVSEYREYLKTYLETGQREKLLESYQGDSSVHDGNEPLKKFYGKVFDLLKQYSPSGKSAREYSKRCKLGGDIGFRPEEYKDWYKLTGQELSSCLVMSASEVEKLKKSHAGYVGALEGFVLPMESYKGRGIVTVGGGKFSLMALLVIKTLRNLHTTLPVEVFIPPSDEGELELCNVVLPQYNAKCIFLSDILPESSLKNFEFTGYQFKSLALIASSFEDVLFLDADNFPVKPLDQIFDEEPYASTGFVLWPDFWRRTTQPVYYEIAGIDVDKRKRSRNCFDDLTPPQVYTPDMNDLSQVPFHDLEGAIPDVSTESGQLMISKSKHLATILLALYYNINGPSWYYPIFSQRASGEGDKETFLTAASFYGLSFYQVKSATGVEGYHRPDGQGFRGVAMLQHDLNQDYARYKAAARAIAAKYESSTSIEFDKSYSLQEFYNTYFGSNDPKYPNEVDIMFAHSNTPKFDPYMLWKNQDLIYQKKHIRSYTALSKINYYDLELENFRAMNQYLCVKKTTFKYLNEKVSRPEDWASMCEYIKDRLNYLEATHTQAVSPST